MHMYMYTTHTSTSTSHPFPRHALACKLYTHTVLGHLTSILP